MKKIKRGNLSVFFTPRSCSCCSAVFYVPFLLPLSETQFSLLTKDAHFLLIYFCFYENLDGFSFIKKKE